MNKKQRFLYYNSCLIIVLLFLFVFKIDNKEIKVDNTIKKPIEIIEPTVEKDGINIGKIQEEYQNEDIIGYLHIPNVLSYAIVKTTDNEYYLNHLLDKSYSIKGIPFMDFRTSFEDRKILIYGHSGEYEDLPFLALHNYREEQFYKEHTEMYLYSLTKKYTYKIFSSYLETNDYDYVNIKSFSGLTWLEHINKLKNKSDYITNISLTDNSKILVLQTCNIDNLTAEGQYRLVIGVLTTIEDNLYE